MLIFVLIVRNQNLNFGQVFSGTPDIIYDETYNASIHQGFGIR